MRNKVSVIVPIYNVEPYIERCLKSLVNQTLKDIEIILIDDCSTDKSLKIAREFHLYSSFTIKRRKAMCKIVCIT